MEAALVFTWTVPHVGREKLALDYAAESMEFFEKLATEGKSTKLEWFFSSGAPVSFAMVKGDYDFLAQFVASDEFLRMQNKGLLLLADYHYYLYAAGDRATKVIEHYGAAGSEVGII